MMLQCKDNPKNFILNDGHHKVIYYNCTLKVLLGNFIVKNFMTVEVSFGQPDFGRCKMPQRNQEKNSDGKEAFTKRKKLLKGGLNRDLKKRMVKALIWSVTLYRAETWMMRGEDVKRI